MGPMRAPNMPHALHAQADERDIFKFFSQAGAINDIQLITDKNTKRSKGMAYIEFKTQEQVFTAIATLNGQLFMQMPVLVRPRHLCVHRMHADPPLTCPLISHPFFLVPPGLQLKTSEVEKNLAWEAQQAMKQQQNNSDAASSLLSAMGGPGAAGMGSCRLLVANLHPALEEVDLKVRSLNAFLTHRGPDRELGVQLNLQRFSAA
jgi:RNA-binding protein 39